MKETFYFTHDYNARSDEKIKKLIRKHWMEWYWVFWSIVEDLYQNANALRMDCDGIAFDMRVDEKVVQSIINDFDLFIIEWDIFGSKSVETRLLERDSKSSKARESARKRWEKKDANALRPQSECNAIKEKKRKEKKQETSIKDFSKDDEVINNYIIENNIWLSRKVFFEFIITRNRNLKIKQEITIELIEKVNNKLIEFKNKLWENRTMLEIEKFIEYHNENNTQFDSIISRLNTWLGNLLK